MIRAQYPILIACTFLSGLTAQNMAFAQQDSSTPAPISAPQQPASPSDKSQSSKIPLLPDDPTVFLGMTITEALAERGPPTAMAAIRGPEAWQDDVEFLWDDGCSFDWFANHVWRIDFNAAYKGSVFGLFIGDASDKALSLLGQPHFVAEDGLVWRLPWRGYPVQLRIAIKDSVITDIAVFRADL